MVVSMKAEINRDGCISCGLCESICPQVFQMADDGIAEVIVDEVDAEYEASALEAQDSCPVSVITVE